MSSAVAASAPFPPTTVPTAPALDEQTMHRLLRQGAVSRNDGVWRVQVVERAGSTNSDLLASIRADGFGAPTLLAAEHQTAGRGRLGRVWNAAPGASLTVSFALRVERAMSALDGVTLACGLAVSDAIAACGVEARLKWPNDLLVDGRKLAGILVEASPSAHGTVLVIGVGVNVQAVPESVDASRSLRPADMRSAGAHELDRNRLATGIGLALQARLAAFATAGFGSCVAEWNRRDAFRNQPVTLQAGHGASSAGIARGVDDGGALLLDTADGLQRIVSGDVSLRRVAPA